MQNMSGKERLKAALRSKDTDRMPWAPLVDGYFIRSLDKQGLNYDYLEAMKYIGCDILERHVAAPKKAVKNLTRRTLKNGPDMREIYETPVGSIFSEKRDSGGTTYISKRLIETPEDMKVYSYICENTTYESMAVEFASREREIGDRGLALPSGEISPVQCMLQFLAGVENTVYLLADYPCEVESLLAAIHERNKRQYFCLASYPCEAIFDYEDTSTTVMSLSMLEKYSMPYINDYADICHAVGKIFVTHMCGKLSGFAGVIGRGRQDGIDSVCPPQTGDLEPWDARTVWGGEKTVIGGIDPPSLVFMTAEQTLERVAEIIKRLENKRGFILSTGDAVPYGTPIENLRAVTKLISLLGPDSLGRSVPREILHAALK